MAEDDTFLASNERERLQSLALFENQARSQGFSRIAGVDEAGRGPLAGPVVAAACIIPQEVMLEGVNDSKQLSAKERCSLFEKILSLKEIDYGIGVIDALLIDQVNILQATFQAMLIAIAHLREQPDYLLIDGNRKPCTSIPSQAIVKGDGRSQSIAAASILAKETRDRLMMGYHTQWPQYGFDQHKGYGTRFHLAALAQYGPCPIHRMSFAPIKLMRSTQ